MVSAGRHPKKEIAEALRRSKEAGLECTRSTGGTGGASWSVSDARRAETSTPHPATLPPTRSRSTGSLLSIATEPNDEGM